MRDRLLLGFVLLFPVLGPAQAAPVPDRAVEEAPPSPLPDGSSGLGGQAGPSRPVRDSVVNIAFAGGSLQVFVDQLAANADVNIVVGALAAEVILPPVEIKNAMVGDVLQAVARIAPEPYRVRAETSSKGSRSTTVHVLTIETKGPAPELLVRVFSLGAVVRERTGLAGKVPGVEAKTVLSALEAGARAQGRPIDLRFHEESLLLFVNGTPAQLRLVEEVLGNLEREQARRLDEASAGMHGKANPDAGGKDR